MKRSSMKNGMAILVITAATLTSVGAFAAGMETVKNKTAAVKVAMNGVKTGAVKTGTVPVQKPELKPAMKPIEKSEPYIETEWPTF